MAALTTSLTLEEAQKLDEEAEANETDAEEKIIAEITRVGKQPNISFCIYAKRQHIKNVWYRRCRR